MPTPTTNHGQHLSTTDAPDSRSAGDAAPDARRSERPTPAPIVRHTRGIEDPIVDARDGNTSGENASGGGDVDNDYRAEMLNLALDYSAELEKASAEEIMQWAHEHIPKLAVTLSMQDTVLADLAEKYAPAADLVFLDTGYHFAETLDVADAVEKRYSNRLLRVVPHLTRREQDQRYGKDLYATDPTLCCHMRKVVPLQETLEGYPAWVTGLKRVDAPSRAHTPVLEIDKAGRLKINPIITWTDDDVENYIVEHDLIRHPLTTQGYPSIGCETCTARVQAGEDPRSGRWQGKEKTECGLHV
ncbi:phosphoadenylyl-sulfate reductase [Corynebacterium parakroppenstedtii]|uniref:phosphoadenylyl-sulfate reductase n=1 Tax=Corynebacterium parakroppenstedtii TaxID=2828363 RepID=UPI001C8F28C0|nr:phosphoadenylyl-sulfate reductase [Corynebacterium parakroppenstedtii]MBY0793892.1 phosphoadenylyl-sulfate reductase [Corynebacterium parakroppenstedtii]